MPISCPIALRNLSQDEFDERDRIVMRCAYASQNSLGRMCDEKVYENDLAHRLRAEGMPDVFTQIPITLSHADFEKIYRLDLVAHDALYELKTVSDLTPLHESQALHYAMLTALNHVKLVNFRNGKVQGRLRFNALMPAARTRLTWEESEWSPQSRNCEHLKQWAKSILNDWGGFLDTRVYEEALIHLCGGEERVLRRVAVVRDGMELGTQQFRSHGDGLCFVVTSFPDSHHQRPHFERLLSFTNMRAMQWINLNRSVVECVTLSKK